MDHPVVFSQAIELWQKMKRLSQPETVEGDKIVDVYEGQLTKLIMAPVTDGGMGLSNPYYTKLTSILKKSDSIQMIRRGGGAGSASRWALLRPPTIELLKQYEEQGVLGTTNRRQKDNSFQQQLTDLNERLIELEDQVAVILEYFQKEAEKENG